MYLKKFLDNHNKFIDDVVKDKYCSIQENNFNDIVERIVKTFKDNVNYSRIKEALYNQRIIPAGSILAALGVEGNRDSMSNCYYIPIEKDSIEGIYEANSRMARIFSKRGGCGTDITILRPKEDKVNNAAKTSSGAVSFLPLFAMTGKTIGQNGRRAAQLVSIDIRHPDAIDFIKAKWNPESVFDIDPFTNTIPDLSSMNISLKVPDFFFKLVQEDKDWNFIFPDIEDNKELYNNTWDGNYENWTGKIKIYKTIKAKEVLNLIAKAAHACGDPGLMYIDTAKKAPASVLDKNLVPVGMNP